MAKRRKRTGTCAYCGKTGEVTRDHVVPRALFGEPVPGNIPIVPACPTCNNRGKAADDNYVRDILAADMRHASHAVTQANFAKLERSAQTGHSTLAKAIERARMVELYSPEGLYMRRVYEVSIDRKRLDRFMLTLARGLHFHHVGRVLPADILYNVKFWGATQDVGILSNAFLQAGAPGRAVGDGTVFEYLYGKAPADPLVSYWLFNFYQRSCWSVATRGPHSVVPQSARPSAPAK